MSFSIGIVGLPNVGKSTLFTALTKKQVDVSNYPFCTIEPNVGTVAVPDERLEKLLEILKPEKILPTTIKFVDIAGLVKGAADGEGLGNKFLSYIREVDAIVEVVRDFTDDNIAHVHGKINPEEDVKTVNLELVLADLETVNHRLEKLEKQSKGLSDKEFLKNIEILKQLKKVLEEEKFANNLEVANEDHHFIKEPNLLTDKPILYVYNVSEEELSKSKSYNKKPYLTICAKLEAELASLSDEEAKEYLESVGLKQTGLDRLIIESYKLLDIITFFTTQNKILQAWTVKQGATAPQAAGRIHSDFEEGFIKAEVIKWEELVEAGSEAQAKEKGLMRTEGKNYQIQDGDVIYFLFKR